MKLAAYALAFGFLAAAATAASADITATQVVNLFQSQGYTDIQVSTQGGQMTVEATQNGAQVHVVYDTATGQILNQTNTAASGSTAATGSTDTGFGSVTATGNTSGTNTGLSGSGDDNESENESSDDGASNNAGVSVGVNVGHKSDGSGSDSNSGSDD